MNVLPEIDVAQAVANLLEPLDPAPRRRVLTWLAARFNVDPGVGEELLSSKR
ncbi:hypothetical protein [Nonomuraea sp. NPDC049709]|uniref:hypothetical protein n=1 Tax=Nonomuraea sp. NPDC049709 TaxID=3154736 RepID=UPI00343DCFA8